MRWGARTNGSGQAERWIDPLARGSLVVAVGAGTFARYGYWPSQFTELIAKYHHGRIPPHVTDLAARLAREKPWEIPEDTRTGPPTIHVGAHSFTPSAEEWEEAGRG